jgi:ABC-type multidrug transport system ATPase subunit
VQQDDMMLEDFSTEECLRFAAKLKTNLTNTQIRRKVIDICRRLGLEHCKKVKIGGMMRKGLSGGERKRSSIGYELITDPHLLLCDEPTSGLDSTTALKIIKMLKKEAVE